MPRQSVYSLLLLILLCALNGCAAPVIGAATDERSLTEHFSDTQLEASVKSAIVSKQASKILAINVYSFYGDTYLVGEADAEAAANAIEAAKGVEGVRSVTTYFFPPGSMTSEDLLIEANINQSLLFTSGIPSGQVQADVWAGQAILLGILSTQEEMDLVLNTVQGVNGVKSIKNYLRLASGASGTEVYETVEY